VKKLEGEKSNQEPKMATQDYSLKMWKDEFENLEKGPGKKKKNGQAQNHKKKWPGIRNQVKTYKKV